MTAPVPDPGALLDRLEEARKAATLRKAIQHAVFDAGGHSAKAAAAILALPEVADLIRLARDGLALRAGVERLAEDVRDESMYGENGVTRREIADRLLAVVADTSGERQ